MTNPALRPADDYRIETVQRSWAGAGIDPGGREPTAGALPSHPMLLLLLAWVLIQFTQFGYIDDSKAWDSGLVISRYCLWPAILGATVLQLRSGASDLAAILRMFVPFVVLGSFSGLVGWSPVDSYKLILFWLLGVLAAAAIGMQVDRDRVRSTLFWIFLLFVVVSIVVAFAVPGIGVMTDNRIEGGAWRGFFSTKSVLGLVCAYSLLFAWFASRVPVLPRLAGAALAGFALMKAHSQGSIADVGLAVMYIVAVGMLRRTRMSPGIKVVILVLGAVAATAALLFGAPYLLSLVGRDTTLTGRTVIWAAYMQRAVYFWLFGAGPGSFSFPASSIVAELAVEFQQYGYIYTPHNMYIAAFGELGVFGFFAFVIPLFYFAFVLPLVNTRSESLMPATIAFMMMVSGMVETHEVFGLGINMFLVIITYAGLKRAIKGEGADGRFAAVPAQQPEAVTPLAGRFDDLYAPQSGPRVLG